MLFAIAAPLQSASTQNTPARNKNRGQYVGFINERDLAWRPFEAADFLRASRPSCSVATAASGAVSLMVRLPAGWRNAAGHHASDMEIFVIEGAVKIGDRRFTERCYSYVPAGVSYGPVTVRRKTIALWFFDGAASFTASTGSEPGAAVDQRVEYKNYFDEPWEAAVEIGFSKQPGIFIEDFKAAPK